MNQLSLTHPTLIEQMTKRLSSAEKQAIIEKTNRFLEKELFLEEIETLELELDEYIPKDWLYIQTYQIKGSEKLSFSFKGKKYDYSLDNIEQAYPQFLQIYKTFHPTFFRGGMEGRRYCVLRLISSFIHSSCDIFEEKEVEHADHIYKNSVIKTNETKTTHV